MDLKEFNFEYFANLEPQKYYDNKDMTPGAIQKREDMMSNKDDQFVATRKNDGEWCMLIKGLNGEVLARSRSISKVTGKYGDYTAKIPHIIDEFIGCFPNGTVLLGELCFEDITKTSKDVGTILRCLPPKAIERQKTNPLSFIIFDILAWDNASLMDDNYMNRFVNYAAWEDSKENFFDTGNRYILTTDLRLDNFDEFLADILGKGGEGMVIQRLDAKYAPGTRPSWQSLKVKKNLDEIEVPVIALSPATMEYTGTTELDSWKFWSHDMENADLSKPNIPVTKFYFYGWPGAIVVDYKGKDVYVSSGLTDDDRDWLSSAGDIIARGGVFASITAMEETADGSLRHPVLLRLRMDIDAADIKRKDNYKN